MSHLISINLGLGNLSDGYRNITVQISSADELFSVSKCRGSLPPAPEITQLYRQWQLLYREFYYGHWLLTDSNQASKVGATRQLTIESEGITNFSQVEFRELCNTLKNQLNSWLSSDSFQAIYLKICQECNVLDEIQLVLETDDPILRQMPWQLWDFFQAYPHAEFVLGTQEYEHIYSQSKTLNDQVRILAIFGNGEGLNLEADLTAIEALPGANLTVLTSPSRRQLNEYLWDPQGWDIFFFAGHSQTDSVTGTGKIQINATDSLPLDQLKNALRKALSHGLHLAIFNSCDGLGLARTLGELNVPQIIVMREIVPDVVAQVFFKHFLEAFAEGQSVYAAVRDTREWLEGLEGEYPCATWLPVICQNPATLPKLWHQLQGTTPSKSDSHPYLPKTVGILATLMTTISVMGVRTLGFIQSWELKAYDQLVQQRPIESKDNRFLLVTITEDDLKSRPAQRIGADSLPDSQLIKLLDTLDTYKPRSIGLDIFRPDDQRTIPSSLNKHWQSDRFFGICQRQDTNTTHHPEISPPALLSIERQGFSDVILDPDNVLRRALLIMGPRAASNCQTQYALSAQLAFHYLEKEGISVNYTQEQELRLGTTPIQRLPKPREGNPLVDFMHARQGGYQRVDTWGYQTLLNFRTHRHTPQNSFDTVALQDVLTGKLNPEMVKDRIVLIGVAAASFGDIHQTPYSPIQEQQPDTPGVVIQAQITSQLISAGLKERPLISVWPLWGEFLWVWGWSVMGGALFWLSRSQVIRILVVGCVLGGGLYGLCWTLLVQGLWVPLIPAVLALGAMGLGVGLLNNFVSKQ